MLIQALQLNKTVGHGASAVRVLRDVQFAAAEGEVVAVMGPSGSGKTTLLHVLAGIERADAGEIWIGEEGLHAMNDHQLSNFRLQHMGFIFQQYHLIPVLSVLENVALPLLGRGWPEKKARSLASEALEQVGLTEQAGRVPGEMSGGQNQRVAIARAIVGEPKVVWADEPTGALDRDTADQIIGLMKRINERKGTTFVIVTHDHQVAAQADRIVTMENGRIRSQGGGERV